MKKGFRDMQQLVCLFGSLLMSLFLIIPTQADYLGEYEEPAKFRIRVDIDEEEAEAGEGEKTAAGNRYAAYLSIIEKCIAQYGDTDSADGTEYGYLHLTGLSFLKLVDFDKDGIEELFLVFHVRTNDESQPYEEHVYVYNVWGYNGRKAVLLQAGNHLYGFNGGQQSVFFMEKPEGTYYLHGAADSFQYNYYYGYDKKQFGLCKTIKGELPSDSWEVDGKAVSGEKARKELKEWGRTSDAKEAWCLTYSKEEIEKVRKLIKGTINFLQRHSKEQKPVPEEKEAESPQVERNPGALQEEKEPMPFPDEKQPDHSGQKKEPKPIWRIPHNDGNP